MTETFFKHKCLNCGKECVNMNPETKKIFCSKFCEKNYKYSDKFIDNRYWEKTPFKEE